jgi:MFS family permease
MPESRSPPPGALESFDVRAARDAQDPVGPLNARGPLPHAEGLHALDWLNFSLAALLMGFGPFAAVKLADRGWVPANIGLALTASGVAGLLTQVPAGELIDISRSRRLLVGMTTTTIISGIFIFGLRPDFPSVFAASLIQDTAGSVLGPGAAISLGLVGQEALAERLGRNQRFASIGGLTAAGIMSVIGYLLSTADVFLVTVAFGIPVILALVRIRADDVNFGRSCCAADQRSMHPQRVSRAVLFKDRRLLTFAICLFLFQVECLYLAADRRNLGARRGALVIVRHVSADRGPTGHCRSLGGPGWGALPVLGGVDNFSSSASVSCRSAQPSCVDSGSRLARCRSDAGRPERSHAGCPDDTGDRRPRKRTGRFNLAQGLVGALSGIGASLNTSISGLVVEKFGYTAGFLSMTVGLIAVASPE